MERKTAGRRFCEVQGEKKKGTLLRNYKKECGTLNESISVNGGEEVP